jgi:tetratricopeptide (TPR) repeat protein
MAALSWRRGARFACCAFWALSILHCAQPNSSEPRDRLYEQAQALLSQQRYAEALIAYEELNRSFDLGTLYVRLGRSENAIEIYQRALTVDSTYTPVLHNLSVIYADQGRFPEAIELLQKAIAYDPLYTPALETLALFYVKQGLYQEAEEMLLKSTASGVESAATYRQLGQLYTRQGRFEQAAQMLERAVTLAPAQAAIWRSLGLLYQQWNRSTEALSYFERSVALEPNHLETHFNKAQTLLRWIEQKKPRGPWRALNSLVNFPLK